MTETGHKVTIVDKFLRLLQAARLAVTLKTRTDGVVDRTGSTRVTAACREQYTTTGSDHSPYPFRPGARVRSATPAVRTAALRDRAAPPPVDQMGRTLAPRAASLSVAYRPSTVAAAHAK